MAHARQQIRDAIVAALTTAGMTAYSSRTYATATLPSVNVTTPNETIEIGVATKQDRLLTIDVTIMVEATANVDDAADAQAVIVEKTVLTAAGVLALVEYIELLSMDSDLSGEGDKPILVMTSSFVAKYRVNESNPEVIIP